MKKTKGLFSAFGLFYIVMISVTVIAFGRQLTQPIPVSSASGQKLFIIDAGHGGEDGGAISPEGDLECDINLQISKKLRLLFALFGVQTQMTREDSDIDYPENCKTVREKKMADFKNRVELVNSSDNAVLLSIHQNKFQTSEPFGAQVIYNDLAKDFGEAMQESLIRNIDERNYRSAVPAENIYLMTHVNKPALLIECGFLSNCEDLSKLKSNEYQLKLSSVIVHTALTFYENKTIC